MQNKKSKMSENLEELISKEIPDKQKQTLIYEYLEQNQIKDINDCTNIVQVALSCIISGDSPLYIDFGWFILNHLKKNNYDLLQNVLASPIFKDTISNISSIKNSETIPNILNWCLNINYSIDKQLIDFSKNIDFLNIDDLVYYVDVYSKFNISNGKESIIRCEGLVLALSLLKIPRTELMQFIKKVEKITKYIQFLIESSEYKEDLIRTCLKVTYTVILKSENPTSVLAAVVNIIDPLPTMNPIFEELNSDDSTLTRILIVLCKWLCTWPSTNRLHIWVLALISYLEFNEQYYILVEVGVSVINQLFTTMCLQLLRASVAPVFFYMIRHSDALFFKISDQIPHLVSQLQKQKGTEEYIKNLQKICFEMECLFPQNPNSFEKLKNIFKDIPGNSSLLLEEVRLWEHNKSQSSGKVGLENLGNTCFMNSVLQALFMTKKFCHAILETETQKSQNILICLQELYSLLSYSHRPSIAPRDLYIVAKPPTFLPGHQHDSSEFLAYFLDQMDEQERQIIKPEKSLSSSNSSNDRMEISTSDQDYNFLFDLKEKDVSTISAKNRIKSMTRWTTQENLTVDSNLQRKSRSLVDISPSGIELTETRSNSTDSGIHSVSGEENSGGNNLPSKKAICSSKPTPLTLVRKAFGGLSITKYICLDCRAESRSKDFFNILHLPIPDGEEPIEIQQLLEELIRPETLSGENRYMCDSCSGLRDAERSIEIAQSPSHLILCLNLFRFVASTGRRTKLLRKIIPTLNISLSVLSSKVSYRLYAKILHSGNSLDCGHYYTIAHDSDKGKWYLFNDNYVVASEAYDTSTRETPYILFYEKEEESPITTTPPLSKRLRELVEKDQASFQQQQTNESKKRRRRHEIDTKPRTLRRQDESDDDNNGPPPSSCGGGLSLESPNRFIF